MRKGLILTLVLGALVLGMNTPANAASPIIDEIPVIIISDLESNTLTIDNNVFEFLNAFNFDDYVTDADTPLASLQWSFYYDGSLSGNVGDITINGVGPLSLPGDDPTAPGANNIRTSGSASFREVALSPGSASSYPDPAPGVTGTIPGFGTYSDIVGDLTVTYYVSDGTAFDFDESFVFTVDTNPGDTAPGDQIVEGPPVLTFTPVALTGWTYFSASGGTPNFFSAPEPTSGTTGGLQIIHPASPGASIIGATYGGWTNAAIAGFNYTAGNIYLARFGTSWSAEQTPGDKTRLLANPAAGASIDFSYDINVADAGHPMQAVGGNTYLAYFVPNAADAGGQHVATFDSLDNGARTTTLTSLETASSTKAAFTGSQQAVAAASFNSNFNASDWDGFSFPALFGIVTATATGTITGGNLTISDPDATAAGTGGVFEWSFGQSTAVGNFSYATGGGLYYNTWSSATVSDGGGGFPQPMLRVRNASPAHSFDNVIRGGGALLTTLAGGSNNYDTFWTSADFSASGGGNMILGFALQNLQGGITQVGGTTTLSALNTWVLTSDDPNLP